MVYDALHAVGDSYRPVLGNACGNGSHDTHWCWSCRFMSIFLPLTNRGSDGDVINFRNLHSTGNILFQDSHCSMTSEYCKKCSNILDVPSLFVIPTTIHFIQVVANSPKRTLSMAKKQTKRERKFQSKGGVKKALEKGTITSKGKLKRKRKTVAAPIDPKKKAQLESAMSHQQSEQLRKRDESDFTGDENLGGLDIETFFESMANTMEGEGSDVEDNDGSDEEELDDDEIEGDDTGKDESDDDEQDEDSEANEGDSEDSEMEEDIEVAAAKMKEEMERLQKSDPDFHKFLKENEKSLLDFNEEEHVAEDEEDADIEQEKKQPDVNATLIDYPLLKSLEQGAFKSHGLKSLKKLIAAYKTACHLSDADGIDHDENKRPGKKYHIDSTAVFDRLMVMTLDRCHEEFTYHLVGKGSVNPQDENTTKDDDMEDNDDIEVTAQDEKPLNPKILTRAHRWLEMKPVMQSFLKSTLHVMNGAKEPELLIFILKALAKYVPFLTLFPRIAQNLLKTLTALWSAPLDSSEDYQVVRLNAFMRIRQMALTQPFPFIEDCLKKTYLAYAKRAKFGTSSSVTTVLPTLTFMGNCVVELYSLDYHSSYQHSFVYIRQLALHLRTAMHKKTPEAFQAVYCWQYVHCLKLWVAVLASACMQGKEEQEVQLLRSLIFPLTEVILGVAQLIPTTRHLPLRLHLVRFLQQLASAAEMFIPTTSILLDALDLKEIGLKPKRVKGRAAGKSIQLPLLLKLPKDDALRTTEQLEACVSEVFLLLNREVDLYRYSAGFPEFTVRICQRLRKFSKETQNSRWRAYSKGCVDLCEKNSSFCIKARAALQEAPKDVKRLECLKPSGELGMGERYDKEISRENRLESTTRPASKSNEAEKKAVEAAKAIPKKKSKKEKLKIEVKPIISKEVAMELQDDVKEGVDWTDSEDSE